MRLYSVRHPSLFRNILLNILAYLLKSICAGLRMSQFNEEIRHSDPSQETITKFIIQKDFSRQNLDDNDLDASKNCLSNDESLSLSFDSHETRFAQLKDVVEYEEQSQIDADEVTPNQECMKKEERPQVLEGDALLIKHKECKPDTSHSTNAKSNAQNTEAFSLFPQKEPLFWVDGYKCNLCGIELPPSFVEERQEHSDFHLAQRLQNEESGSSSSTTPTSKRRSAHSNNLLNLSIFSQVSASH